MSKRFGRNQKRKMKAEIQALSNELFILKKLGQRNREIVENTAAVLGRHFITLDPSVQAVRMLDDVMPHWRIPRMEGVPREVSLGGRIDPASFLDVVLPVLRGIPDVLDDIRGETHIRFIRGEQKLGYAISDRALALMPRSAAVQRIAEEMAYHIVDSLPSDI